MFVVLLFKIFYSFQGLHFLGLILERNMQFR